MTRDELIEKMARAIANKVYGHDEGWKQFYDVREALPVIAEWLEGEAKQHELKASEAGEKGVTFAPIREKEIRRLIATLKGETK